MIMTARVEVQIDPAGGRAGGNDNLDELGILPSYRVKTETLVWNGTPQLQPGRRERL